MEGYVAEGPRLANSLRQFVILLPNWHDGLLSGQPPRTGSGHLHGARDLRRESRQDCISLLKARNGCQTHHHRGGLRERTPESRSIKSDRRFRRRSTDLAAWCSMSSIDRSVLHIAHQQEMFFRISFIRVEGVMIAENKQQVASARLFAEGENYYDPTQSGKSEEQKRLRSERQKEFPESRWRSRAVASQ